MRYLGYALLCLLGLFVILLAVAVIRAIKIKSSPSSAKPAITVTKQEEEQYANTLSAMVRVPSVSSRGQEDLAEFENLQRVMREKFPNVFEKMECVNLDGNLLLRLPGKDSKRNGVLLMGHQDVVPADPEGWKHAPFSGDIADGCIHGRGAMDCKCTVMAEFQAMDELIAEGFVPECDVYLASSVNEEVSGGGSEKTVEYLKSKGIRLDVVMDEGGALMKAVLPGMKGWCAAVGVTEKGHMNVKIIAKGNGGHSSTPPKNTPLARLAAFITDMEKARPFKCELSPTVKAMLESAAPMLDFPVRLLLGNLWLFKPLLLKVLPMVSAQAHAFIATTFAFTMCDGSRATNVIPGEAYVICNLRPAHHQNAQQSLEVLRKYAEKHDLELEVLTETDASGCADINGEEFKYLTKCVNECYPEAGVIPYLMTGGTDCRNYEPVSDNCLRFCPIRMTDAQLKAMHAVNESIGVSELAESVKFYKYYIKNHK